MTAVRWLKFDPRDHSDAEIVLLSDEMAREIRRSAYGRQVAVDGEVVHFLTNGTRQTQYVRLDPSSEQGRAERDAQLSADLITRFLDTPQPAAPIVARLRELADTLAGITPPTASYASVQLVFEDVTALDATAFASSLLRHVPGSYMETTPSTVAVHLPGRDAEACIELAFPEAAPEQPEAEEPEVALSGIPLIDTTELDANVASLERTIAELTGGASA